MFADAKQAEIIRSNQKDDFYSNYIKSSLAEIVQDFFGELCHYDVRNMPAFMFINGFKTCYLTLG